MRIFHMKTAFKWKTTQTALDMKKRDSRQVENVVETLAVRFVKTFRRENRCKFLNKKETLFTYNFFYQIETVF